MTKITRKQQAEELIKWIEDDYSEVIASVYVDGKDYREDILEHMIEKDKCSICISGTMTKWITVFIDWTKDPCEVLTEWSDCDEESDTMLWNFNWSYNDHERA